MRSVQVAIIGGSTVGTALAVMLQRNGIEAEVFEAAQLAVPRTGGVIGLEHTVLTALEDVGVPQDELVPVSSANTERVVNIVLSNGDSPIQRKECLYPGRTTTWTDVQHALMTRLRPGTYHPGHRLKDVTQDGKLNKAILLFANGEAVTAKVVVGADGRTSYVRQRFDPGRKLDYAGYVAHRGLYPDCPPDVALEFVRLKAPGTTFNTWPIHRGEGIDGSARVAVDWTFYLNETPALYAKHYGKEPTVTPYILPRAVTDAGRKFVDEAAARLLPKSEADMVRGTALRAVAAVVDIPPPERMVWAVGDTRVVAVGDALGVFHPLTARGANAGIEEAADLTGVMRQHVHHGADLDAALQAMEARQLRQVRCTLREGPLIGASMGLGKYGHSFETLLGHAA